MENETSNYRLFRYFGKYYFCEVAKYLHETMFAEKGSVYLLQGDNIYNDKWISVETELFLMEDVEYVGVMDKQLQDLIDRLPCV